VEKRMLLLDLLEQTREMEADFVSALSNEERSQSGTLEEWSAKDVISHITARKALMADGLLAVAEARTPIGSADLDQENAVLFEGYHGKPWAEVLKLAEDTYQRVVQQVGSCADEELAKLARFFPWQRARPLWRLVVGSGSIHPVGHMAEFHRKRGERARAAEMTGKLARSMVGLDHSPEWQGEAKYSLACHYALLGAKAEAIGELREAVHLSPVLMDYAEADPDLADLRDEPEYRTLLKE